MQGEEEEEQQEQEQKEDEETEACSSKEERGAEEKGAEKAPRLVRHPLDVKHSGTRSVSLQTNPPSSSRDCYI